MQLHLEVLVKFQEQVIHIIFIIQRIRESHGQNPLNMRIYVVIRRKHSPDLFMTTITHLLPLEAGFMCRLMEIYLGIHSH